MSIYDSNRTYFEHHTIQIELAHAQLVFLELGLFKATKSLNSHLQKSVHLERIEGVV